MLGSSIGTGWKRRSKAASFSIYFLYSFKVVAPTQCNSPLASAGFNILEASIDPSAAPAPIRVCNSSIKSTMSPEVVLISLRTDFNLSSNSPRYLAPAISCAKSNDNIRLSNKLSGTSLCMTRWARPSIIAVFPTPGSPIRTGLFFVRRDNTCITLRISKSLPITGSSFPERAALVKSTQYLSKTWNLLSGSWSVTLWLPRMDCKPFSKPSWVIPKDLKISLVFLWLDMASKKCSALKNSSCILSAISSAFKPTSFNVLEIKTFSPPETRGNLLTISSSLAMIEFGSAPTFFSNTGVIVSASLISSINRCSHSIAWWPSREHRFWAFEKASCNLIVICSKRIKTPQSNFVYQIK